MDGRGKRRAESSLSGQCQDEKGSARFPDQVRERSPTPSDSDCVFKLGRNARGQESAEATIEVALVAHRSEGPEKAQKAQEKTVEVK